MVPGAKVPTSVPRVFDKPQSVPSGTWNLEQHSCSDARESLQRPLDLRLGADELGSALALAVG